MQMYMNLICL